MSTARPQTIELAAIATRKGKYLYREFEVPDGVNRIDVRLEKRGLAQVGVGLFDERGAGYQSPGFRGILGAENCECYLSAHSASTSFRPGVIRGGTWTVVVPVFRLWTPARIRVVVTLSFGPPGPEAVPDPEPGVVNPAPGWYRGDLHCHTDASSDAHSSHDALTPSDWARVARGLGLDFISLTDHNVTTQNWRLARDTVEGVLLLAGEEMTNWPYGHATVTGLSPGDWLDWRQRPEGVPLGLHEARIQECIAHARWRGAYIAAAHPLGMTVEWKFLREAEKDPAARPDGLEVWTGPFGRDDWDALKLWDRWLRRGWRVWASGGSDTHGLPNRDGFAPGHPTTVVHAASLSKEGVVSALKAGRSYVTRSPRGPELYLTAQGPDGGEEMVGGTVYGRATDRVELSARVVGGAGMRLILLRDGLRALATRIASDDQTVGLAQEVGRGGYVRAELRGESDLNRLMPWRSRLGMEALTNPIFLARSP